MKIEIKEQNFEALKALADGAKDGEKIRAKKDGGVVTVYNSDKKTGKRIIKSSVEKQSKKRSEKMAATRQFIRGSIDSIAGKFHDRRGLEISNKLLQLFESRIPGGGKEITGGHLKSFMSGVEALLKDNEMNFGKRTGVELSKIDSDLFVLKDPKIDGKPVEASKIADDYLETLIDEKGFLKPGALTTIDKDLKNFLTMETNKTGGAGTIFRGNSPTSRYLKAAAKSFGASLVKDIVPSLVAKSNSLGNLEFDPARVKKKLPLSEQKERIGKLEKLYVSTLNEIVSAKIPPGLCKLCSTVYDHVRKAKDTVQGRNAAQNVIFLRLLSPALSAPATVLSKKEATKLTNESKRTMLYVSKILTNQANKKLEPGKDMGAFSPIVKGNARLFEKFLANTILQGRKVANF